MVWARSRRILAATKALRSAESLIGWSSGGRGFLLDFGPGFGGGGGMTSLRVMLVSVAMLCFAL